MDDSHIVFIALGSNLGDRHKNIQAALRSLQQKVSLKLRSSIYETEPWGYYAQPSFLNMVAKVETELSPHELLSYLKSIELNLGREETFLYGPRLIDLDILFYDNAIIENSDLIIPHPRLHERNFVLVPLVEIAPFVIHPILGRKVNELLSSVNVDGVKLFLRNK